MLNTIKSKITVLTIGLLIVLGIVVTAAAVTAFYRDKELIIAGNKASITAFEGQMNTEIAELEKNAMDLSVMAELYYLNGKRRPEGEFFTKKILNNYPDSMGNGIYFRPYKVNENQKKSCIHAVWKGDNQIDMLASCTANTFDYFNQNWYPQILSDLKKGHNVSWARPYKSTQLGNLMTTVGSGIYDGQNLVGMATVDWDMDTILKSILKIKPTPNSFVLFADKKNDYIIATTEPGVSNDSVFGQPLNGIAWYSDRLKEGQFFEYHGTTYIPYIKELKNGFSLIVNVPLYELFGAAVHHLSVLLTVLLISTVIIVSILYRVLKHNINQPITHLTEMARKISRGNLDMTIHLDEPAELAQMAEAFNKMKTDIRMHLMHLAKVSGEKEKIEAELNIAQTIQLSALPTDFPMGKDLSIRASMTPAKAVGGDFYDFFPIDGKRTAFVMADVSGKGITAALYMMSAKTALKNMLQAGYDLAEAVAKANRTLYDNNARGMFVTAFVGILNRQTGRIDYISAGHCPPLHRTKSGWDYVPVVRNLMLGVMADYHFEVGHLTLKPQDCLFLYTDGVTEAQTREEKLYGPERLKRVLNQATPSDTLKRVRRGIRHFTKGAEQSDDITMMEIVFRPKQTNG